MDLSKSVKCKVPLKKKNSPSECAASALVCLTDTAVEERTSHAGKALLLRGKGHYP